LRTSRSVGSGRRSPKFDDPISRDEKFRWHGDVAQETAIARIEAMLAYLSRHNRKVDAWDRLSLIVLAGLR